MKVVVITPKKERLELIKRAYNSLLVSHKLKSTLRDFEWVIYDDGSDDWDDTWIYYTEVLAKSPFKVTLIRGTECKDVTYARNRLINHVIKYIEDYSSIMLLDSDDYVTPDWIEHITYKQGIEVEFHNDIKHRSRKFLTEFPCNSVNVGIGALYEHLNEFDCMDCTHVLHREYIDRVRHAKISGTYNNNYTALTGFLNFYVLADEKETWSSEFIPHLVFNPITLLSIHPLQVVEYQEDGKSLNWKEANEKGKYRYSELIENYLLAFKKFGKQEVYLERLKIADSMTKAYGLPTKEKIRAILQSMYPVEVAALYDPQTLVLVASHKNN